MLWNERPAEYLAVESLAKSRNIFLNWRLLKGKLWLCCKNTADFHYNNVVLLSNRPCMFYVHANIASKIISGYKTASLHDLLSLAEYFRGHD